MPGEGFIRKVQNSAVEPWLPFSNPNSFTASKHQFLWHQKCFVAIRHDAVTRAHLPRTFWGGPSCVVKTC